MEKIIFLHAHMQTYLYANKHALLAGMMDDVHEILQVCRPLPLLQDLSLGKVEVLLHFSCLMGNSEEKKEVHMWCTCRLNLVLYYPNNMPKQMPSQIKHYSPPPVFTDKQRHTLSSVDCSAKGGYSV